MYDTHTHTTLPHVFRLTSKTVEGAPLTFQGVYDVHCGDCLPLRVFGVCDRVTNNVLEEHFEHTASLLVDETGDTLHAATSSQTTDGRLRDALDVVAKYLSVTLRTAFPQTFSSLSAAGHLAVEFVEART